MTKTTRHPASTGAWWTVDEFAERTRRTPAAVRASIARRDLPAVLIGRRYFIDAGHFDRLFAAAARACAGQELHTE